MEDKRFNCKMEDVPVITGFVLASMESDMPDFMAYSPIFSSQFVDNIRVKQDECYEIARSAEVVKQQKVVKKQIEAKLSEIRIKVNLIEGYLKFAGSDLDIQLDDFGQKSIRSAISNGNSESVISEGRMFIINLKRNQAVLQNKGMSPESLAALADMFTELYNLNNNHNSKKNERTRATESSIKTFNELWDKTTLIIDAARAMYRGVNDVKLKEYTVSNLLKRVHNSTGSTSTDTEATKKA